MRRATLLVAATMLSGCGAIMHGTRQDIDVQGSPAGSKIETSPASGVFTTPTTLNLERKNSYVLTFTSPGYTPATFNIHNGIGPGTVIADVVLTGLVGVVVDGLTGAWYGLSPDAATVTLVRAGGNEHDADAIHISLGSSHGGQQLAIDCAAPNVRVQVTKR